MKAKRFPSLFIRLIVIAAVFLPALLAADSGALKGALDSLYAKNSVALPVAFGNFTFGDTKAGTDFSRYVMDMLGTAISSCPQYRLFPRERLEEILSAQSLNLSDIMAGEVRVGNLEGFKALICGRFWDSCDRIELFLELIDIEAGTTLRTVKVDIPRKEIPARIRVTPENAAWNPAYDQFRVLFPNASSGLKVSIWPDRGEGGTYYDGEQLTWHVSAIRDCYLKIYLVDASGRLQLLFPCDEDENAFFRAGTGTLFPRNERYWFELHEPYGVEIIKVVASLKPFASIETSWTDLGAARPDLVLKSLGAFKSGDVAEAVTMYSIVRK